MAESTVSDREFCKQGRTNVDIGGKSRVTIYIKLENLVSSGLDRTIELGTRELEEDGGVIRAK